VETDTANPDVGKAYQKSVKSFSLVNLDENEGWLDLLDIVDASKDDEVVVNTAARNNEGVNRYGSMFDDKLNEFGWPFISLFLINQQRDSCEMLTEYMNVVKHGRIHVVRNRFFGMAPSLFELYDNSPLRQAVEARQGLSLFLPQLATRVTNLVQSNRLTLERARETATLGSRAEIERWRRNALRTFSIRSATMPPASDDLYSVFLADLSEDERERARSYADRFGIEPTDAVWALMMCSAITATCTRQFQKDQRNRAGHPGENSVSRRG